MEFDTEDNWDDFPEFRDAIISWTSEKVDSFFYHAFLKGKKLSIRYNNFPDEPARTLFVDGLPILNFNDWPKNWINDETS
jgi:hypothetical protein